MPYVIMTVVCVFLGPMYQSLKHTFKSHVRIGLNYITLRKECSSLNNAED